MLRPLSLSFLLLLSLGALAAPRNFEGRAVILHPAQALSEADQAELAAKGVIIKDALAGGRYLARVTDEVSDARILSVEALTPEKKLHRSAIREAGRGRASMGVHVIFHRDVPFDEARQAVLAAGGAIDDIFATDFLPSQRIEARIAPYALNALAADDRVLSIAGGRALKIGTNNAVTAGISHVTELHSAPYGLTGAGVTVSLFELAEAQATHPEFNGRLTLAPTTIGGGSTDKRHATHVAGTIGASGLNSSARGMAPGVKIEQFCVRNTASNDCVSGWQSLKKEKLHPLGVIADNNSWGYVWGWEESGSPIWNFGDANWGAYDQVLTAPIDQIAIDRDILFVHSAGNDGSIPTSIRLDSWKSHRHADPENDYEIFPGTYCVSQDGSGTDCPTATCTATIGTRCELSLHHPPTPYDTMGTTAAAKNILAVGAVDSSLNIIGFSSRGPAKDGRIKPEIVARGASVLSPVPTNSYSTLNGTSMAAPAITGMAALLTEQWRRTFAGANPGAATLKALLIAGAQDLGRPGPDYTFGFGLANAKNSVDMIRTDAGGGTRIRKLTLAKGTTDVVEFPLVLRMGQQNLRFVLNWNDPATPVFGSDDIAAKSQVNDLDLRVIDPAGNVHLPYVLNPNAPAENATRGVNTIDNTEMVEIATGVPGTYRVIVAGTNVFEGPQSAVVVTNAPMRQCQDVQESNDLPEKAWGNIVSGAFLTAGLCAANDVDYYKFVATKIGAVSVTVTTGDTPLRVTLTGTGISRTQDIPADTTATLNANALAIPNAVLVKVEPIGAIGPESAYTLTATYQEVKAQKRRSARH